MDDFIRRLSIAALLVISIIVFLPAQKPTVAVMPFENINKDTKSDWLSAGIAATITNNLVKMPEYIAVERYQINKVIDEQKLQLSGAVDEKTAVNVGRIAAVTKMIMGDFQVSGKNIRLSGRIIDVESGEIQKTAQATGKMEDIFHLQDEIVVQLLFGESTREGIETETTSLEAYEHFGKGVLLENNKDYQGALTQYAKALESDEAFSIAKSRYQDAFWSLNPGNYWRYRSEVRSEDGELYYAGTEIRRAGKTLDWNGEPAFSYISEIDNITVEGVYRKGIKGIEYLGHNSNMSKISFDPPALIFPYQFQVGDSWTMSNQATVKIENKPLKRETHTHTIKVLRQEKLTVPMGTFDTYVFEYTQQQPTATVVTLTWFAPGAGMIRTQTKMTMEYGGTTSATFVITDLIDFKIY